MTKVDVNIREWEQKEKERSAAEAARIDTAALKYSGGGQIDCVNGNNQLNLLRERNDDADYTRTLRPTAERLQVT